MFPVSNRSSRYPKKSKVLGVTIDRKTKAYPFKELREHGSSTFVDTINDKPYTIHWSEEDEYARILNADGDEFPSVIVYWFAWYAFHPETLVFEADSAGHTR
jgi:hypothetical protein